MFIKTLKQSLRVKLIPERATIALGCTEGLDTINVGEHKHKHKHKQGGRTNLPSDANPKISQKAWINNDGLRHEYNQCRRTVGRGDPICERQSAEWRQIPQSEHGGKHTLCTLETANLGFAEFRQTVRHWNENSFDHKCKQSLFLLSLIIFCHIMSHIREFLWHPPLNVSGIVFQSTF